MAKQKPSWLRHELMLRLMLPLLAIVVATGAIGAYTAQRLTDRVFDRWLLDTAHSLANQLHFVDGKLSAELPMAVESMLAYDEIDRTYFRVVRNGQHLAGYQGIPIDGERQSVYAHGRAYDASVEGRAVRVAAIEVRTDVDADTVVLVAETLIKRQTARDEILLMLLPLGALLIAAVMAINSAVQRTILPLAAIADRWNERSQASLVDVGVEDVPRELLPFARALNNLLARIRAMLARERQFAANAAHQLRTPLAGLQLGLTRAVEAPDLASTRAVLKDLEETTQRTARLVQQLLALSFTDPEARGELTFIATDLVALTQDVGAMCMDLALQKGIDLELKAPATPILIDLHRGLMSEALANVLDNAVRYTPRGGRVLVEVGAQPPSITVSDSGPGIVEHERELVFERFVRGTQATGDGSGLGLAIVREIVQLHNAQVSLSQSALGGAALSIVFVGDIRK